MTMTTIVTVMRQRSFEHYRDNPKRRQGTVHQTSLI